MGGGAGRWRGRGRQCEGEREGEALMDGGGREGGGWQDPVGGRVRRGWAGQCDGGRWVQRLYARRGREG